MSFFYANCCRVNVSGLYPWTSLISHCCVPNVKIITRDDFSYISEATVNITEGTVDILNGTRLRANGAKSVDQLLKLEFDHMCRLSISIYKYDINRLSTDQSCELPAAAGQLLLLLLQP